MNNIDKRYNDVYKRGIELCPDMKPLIEKIRLIPPPKANEYRELYLRKKNDDSKAVNRTIEMYLRTALRLSIAAAEKYSFPLDEIFSEAVIGLAEYANRYDPQNYKSFVSCIISGIRKGINAYIRQNISYNILQPVRFDENVKEVKLAIYYTENPMPYKEYCEDKNTVYDGKSCLIDHIYWADVKGTIDTVLDTLSEREQKIIRLKYGLGSCEQRSIKEIADMFYVDKERIISIEKKALRKLKHRLKINKLLEL